MMKVNVTQLENDYQVAQSLMGNHKYVQAVVHLEKLLKQNYDDTTKEMFKKLYKDIIFAYRTINNKTRADYYYTKALGLFGEIGELVINKESKETEESIEKNIEDLVDETVKLEVELEEEITENIIEENEISIKNDVELGEDKVLRTANDFEVLNTSYKIDAKGANEVNFNSIFVEITTTLESKKYFGYFKLNLNKLNDCLGKGIENLERAKFLRLKWEVNTLINIIEKNGVSSFDNLYKLEFEEIFNPSELNEGEEFDSNLLSLETNGTFDFSEETKEFDFFDKSEITEEENTIDKIVEKNRGVFEEHNTLFELDLEYSSTNEKLEEVTNVDKQSLDTNMDSKLSQNETIIVEINTEKVRENNLEVSKVKDVVLEVLENLRKADLDIFSELKDQSEERAQKIGVEKEKKGLLSGLEGMLEIKFGVVSLDIVPEMKKIDELDRLYEVKEKILATRDFTEIEKIVGVVKKL